MSETVRKIIQMVRVEGEVSWEALAEHFELCASCGGIPTGSYGSDTPFVECESYNCDVAFEKMCDDFIDETGNGNSTRNLRWQLHDLMEEHKDLGDFSNEEANWLKDAGESIAGMSQQDLIWSRLNSFDRLSLNTQIVEYWRKEREGEEE